MKTILGDWLGVLNGIILLGGTTRLVVGLGLGVVLVGDLLETVYNGFHITVGLRVVNLEYEGVYLLN